MHQKRTEKADARETKLQVLIIESRKVRGIEKKATAGTHKCGSPFLFLV